MEREDKVILVPFFMPVENRSGLAVSQEVFSVDRPHSLTASSYKPFMDLK